jgi:uncharacterized protein (TIGR03437 family)
MLRHSACAAFLIAGLTALVSPSFAQTLPSVSTLTGNYSVRYLGVNSCPDSACSTDVVVSFSGTFAFDGKGGFTVTGQGTTGSGALQILTSGQYNVYSNGMLELLNPFDNSGSSVLYGGFGVNGILFASSTESYYVDTFIGIPQTTGASNATLSGTYNMVSLEFLGGSLNASRDTFSSITADGKGSLGNVSINGTAQSLNGTASTQTSSGATYSLTANGTGTITFPAPSNVAAGNVLLSGTKVLAVSPDGNLFIAGGQSGFDFVIGLKSAGATSTQQLNGLYYTGYLLNQDPGTSNQGVYAAEGAANELATLNNTEIYHQRTNCDYCSNAYDDISDDIFAFNTGGTASFTGFGAFALGPNADMAIGSGLGNSIYQLVFYVRTPAASGTGVFLNPQGVVNAASFAPFTAQYSPGEVVTMYGTGIATTDANLTALPFPNTLGNVQVKVGDGSTSTTINAPLYAVCASCNPQQISAVIPYNTSSATGYITFQVINNGTPSNVVTGYLGATSPGVFTVPPGGIFSGAIQHATDFSLVTTASPAKAGETVVAYCTGLGAVTPAVTAGAAAPSSPAAQVPAGLVAVAITDSQGNYFQLPQTSVLFTGLTPTVGGLYQVNFVVPSGMASGNAVLEIDTGYTDSAGNAYLDVAAYSALIPIK